MITIERTVDISRPIQTETLRGNEFKQEANAHTFRISVTNNGAAVALTGSVSASMLLADGSGLTLGGSLDNGVAVLTLPQAAYGVPGRFLLAIYSVQTGATEAETVKTCIYACVGAVINTYGDQQYDPGNLIPDAETLAAYIEACQTATTAANDAAGRAETAALTAVTYAEQAGKTEAEKSQARTNIGAAGLAELPLTNVLLPQLNVSGTHADTSRGRTVTVMRNAVTYKRTASNSTGRAYVLTGDTFRNISVSGSYAVSASDLVEADFIALPECISEAWARRVYLWLYSPDNPNLTLYNSTTAQQNRVLLATRAQGGTIYMDNSGAGRPWGNRGGGFFAFPIASTLPELWSQMVTDRTLAVYYICKTNNAAKDGTLYWGIGVADHDLTAIPDAPAADGTYTLKVTVADGVPTYAWANETTGLMSMSPMSLSPAAIADETSDESEE